VWPVAPIRERLSAATVARRPFVVEAVSLMLFQTPYKFMRLVRVKNLLGVLSGYRDVGRQNLMPVKAKIDCATTAVVKRSKAKVGLVGAVLLNVFETFEWCVFLVGQDFWRENSRLL